MSKPLIKEEYIDEVKTALRVLQRFSHDSKKFTTLDIYEYWLKLLLGEE